MFYRQLRAAYRLYIAKHLGIAATILEDGRKLSMFVVQRCEENAINKPLAMWCVQQEAQLMLTTGSTRLLAVSRARAISDGTLT